MAAWAACSPPRMASLRAVKSLPLTNGSDGAITTSACASSVLLMLWPMIVVVCSSMLAWPDTACADGSAEMFTAITKVAPICLA